MTNVQRSRRQVRLSRALTGSRAFNSTATTNATAMQLDAKMD